MKQNAKAILTNVKHSAKDTFSKTKQTLIKVFSPNPNIKRKDFYKAAGLLVVLFILIFLVLNPLQDNPTIGKHIKTFDRICLINCKSDKCKAYTKACRGVTYNLTGVCDSADECDQYDGCIFNIWEFSHIIMHGFIGYWLDIRYSLGIGLGFELFEWSAYGCENYTDIVWNTIGCAIGSYIRINII